MGVVDQAGGYDALTKTEQGLQSMDAARKAEQVEAAAEECRRAATVRMHHGINLGLVLLAATLLRPAAADPHLARNRSSSRRNRAAAQEQTRRLAPVPKQIPLQRLRMLLPREAPAANW